MEPIDLPSSQHIRLIRVHLVLFPTLVRRPLLLDSLVLTTAFLIARSGGSLPSSWSADKVQFLHSFMDHLCAGAP